MIQLSWKADLIITEDNRIGANCYGSNNFHLEIQKPVTYPIENLNNQDILHDTPWVVSNVYGRYANTYQNSEFPSHTIELWRGTPASERFGIRLTPPEAISMNLHFNCLLIIAINRISIETPQVYFHLSVYSSFLSRISSHVTYLGLYQMTKSMQDNKAIRMLKAADDGGYGVVGVVSVRTTCIPQMLISFFQSRN